MDEIKQKYKKPLSIRSMSSRIRNREDCIYKNETIQSILIMYFEECEKALENGEKVGLSGIGSLIPKVHTPITYNVRSMNDEDGNKPYTTVQFIRVKENKRKMNSKYLRNINDGFAGLGEYCQCNQMQKNILINKGFIKLGREEGNEN